MELVEIFKNRGLSDELINNISEYMDKNKIYTTSIKNADEKCSKLETEINNLKGQLDTANTTIKDLKKNNKDNETLQNTIAEHEKTIENLKKDKINSIKESAIDAKFANVPEKYKKLLKNEVDREKITVNEDDTLSGLDEQCNPLIETYSELIEDKGPTNTGSPGDYARKNNKIENNSQSSFMEAIKNNQLRK